MRELAFARDAVVLTVGAYAIALAPDTSETSSRHRSGGTSHSRPITTRAGAPVTAVKFCGVMAPRLEGNSGELREFKGFPQASDEQSKQVAGVEGEVIALCAGVGHSS